MKKIIFKTLFTAASLCICLNAAEQTPPSRVYLPSIRTCLDCQNKQRSFTAKIDMDAMALIARQAGLEFALHNEKGSLVDPVSGDTETLQEHEGKIYAPKANWDPAFRLALAFFTPFDDWNLQLAASSFRTKAHMTTEMENTPNGFGGPGIMPLSAGSAPDQEIWGGHNTARWGYAQAKWKMRFKDAEIALNRNYCFGTYLSILTGFGIKTIWIKQKYRVAYRNGNWVDFVGLQFQRHINYNDVFLKCRSYGIGPIFNFDTQWRLGYQWNVIAKAAAALIGTRFSTLRSDVDDTTDQGLLEYHTEFILRNKFWTFRPYTKFDVGLGWNICTNMYGSSNQNLGLSLLYEIQTFWKQNEFIQSEGAWPGLMPAQSNLVLHGFVANLNFIF